MRHGRLLAAAPLVGRPKVLLGQRGRGGRIGCLAPLVQHCGWGCKLGSSPILAGTRYGRATSNTSLLRQQRGGPTHRCWWTLRVAGAGWHGTPARGRGTAFRRRWRSPVPAWWSHGAAVAVHLLLKVLTQVHGTRRPARSLRGHRPHRGGCTRRLWVLRTRWGRHQAVGTSVATVLRVAIRVATLRAHPPGRVAGGTLRGTIARHGTQATLLPRVVALRIVGTRIG